MNPVLVAAGIFLSAKIVSFISNELTEAELKKQKDIDEEIRRIYESYNSENDESLKERIRNNDNVIEKKKEIRDYLLREVSLRQAEYEAFYEEIRNSKRHVNEALKAKNNVHTPLRKNSLELLFRQLCEAQEKCFAYRQYLEIYQDELSKSKDEETSVFLMQLPQTYPYVGRVVWINNNQIKSGQIVYDIPDLYNVYITITDNQFYNYDGDITIPIMITKVRKKTYYASIEKGEFKSYELTNTHLGVSATVKEIYKDYIVLTYKEKLELRLLKEHLINPNRFPPIRSNIIVYPIKWDYELNGFEKDEQKFYPVTVSERKEDAGSSFTFKNLPVCFNEDDYSVFFDYYMANNLQEYDGEFLIGPVGPDDTKLKKGSKLKLQLGDIPLFYLEIDELNDRTDILRYYFKFHHMCDKGEMTFSADDIFTPLDVNFSPYYYGTSTEMIQHYMEIDIDDVEALIWDLFEEFRIQNQIKNDRDGLSYFFKWESITNQLISVLEQGDSVNLEIDWCKKNKRNCIFAEIKDKDILDDFIQEFAKKADNKLLQEWKPQFFIKDYAGNRYVAEVLDAGKHLRIVGKDVYFIFGNQTDSIELFAAHRPYAEYKQREALRMFRTGQVINPAIQAACMNSSQIISSDEENKELRLFHNVELSNNSSQKNAVEKGYKEKNIFFIQGPPGTGKTTVIREIVEQVIEADDYSRVLIVSQANVAVDNALSGLVEKFGDITVRCGNGNKVSEEFHKYRLQKRCQDYLDELNDRKNDFKKKFYDEWMNTIISDESGEYSPALYELIIRNNRLVGATCVGLAKKNIGLERAVFDLVIIDEAGKALPAELLIPLIRAKKAIIIGDQKQLPPVINPILYDEEKIELEERTVSENDLFCHSFFERLYDNAPDSCKIMLDTQYRMPAVIGTAISRFFYGGKLLNGSGTESRKSILFDSNISFINFDDNKLYCEKKDIHNQITNLIEAESAVSLVLSIREKNSDCKIAVITPYKGQKKLISNTLVESGINFRINNIFIDTIDSFQGSEADVVIFCTTRAVKPTVFFRDHRRINVALSRVKKELIILGSIKYFKKYNEDESCLPGLADYIKEYGVVLMSQDCNEIQTDIKKQKNNELILSTDDINLPSDYYMQDIEYKEVEKKIEEYYANGDFLDVFTVKKTLSGYILVDNYVQYKALQELDLSECLCRLC